MVELCELKMMNKEMDYWPSDIDQHVAQLDFDNSTSMMIDQSLFGSSTGGVDITDPDNDDDEDEERAEQAALAAAISTDVVISTDSLDMDLIRDCNGGAINKNEYKLTFEDSGQWTTTSGIGASVTTNSNGSPPMRRVVYRSQRPRQQYDHQQTITAPSSAAENTTAGRSVFGGMLDRHFGLRLLEQLNNDEWAEAIGEANEDEKQKLIDNLLNNVATTATNFECDDAMTTWGRIQKTEPFDAKTYSSLQEQRHLHQQQQRNNGEFGSDNISGCPIRPFSCGDVLLLPAALQPISQLRTTADTNDKKWRTTNLVDNNYNNNENNSKASTHSSSQRTSLLANFVEQHHSKHSNNSLSHANGRRESSLNEESRPADYEYNEVYMGDGLYVDVNKNEIGYIPESTASIQRSGSSYQSNSSDAQNGKFAHPRRTAAGESSAGTSSYGAPQSGAFQSRAVHSNFRGRNMNTNNEMPPSFTAPDLKFLSLTHKTPSFCRSQISLDEMLKRARNGSLLFSENIFGDEKICLEASSELSILDRHNAQPDSGLGSSSSSGPSHIEDWPSLAVLLPRHVVDACSFFKTNSSLLTGSSASGSLNNIEGKHSSANNIERKASSSGGAKIRENLDENIVNETEDAACRTCFNVRRRRLHPPPWAHRQSNSNKSALCDCTSCCCGCCCAPTTQSEIYSSQRISSQRLSNSASTSALAARMSKLNAAELSVVGLPLYNSKRALVERVVEGVAEIARGASAVVLYSALERLLSDGLLEGSTPWTVIVKITGPGPATNNIFKLVKSLEASEKPENSRISHFFKEVLNLNSLEGWLSYVVLKENVLAKIYADTAFLLRANSAYRSLFWRLIESIELLSVLSQCHKNSRRWQAATSASCYAASGEQVWGSASRLPSDSRIPKSSSIPEKLTPSPVITVKTFEETPKTSKPINTTFTTKKQVALNQTSTMEAAVKDNADAAETPSTSFAAHVEKKSSATFPRGSSTLTALQRRASKIPIASPTAARSVSNSQTMISSPSATFRSRSLHSRSTRTATPGLRLIAKARERVSESDALNASQTILELNKGERVRVLSIRGDISRCCRVNSRFGALLNGVVPTRKLDLRSKDRIESQM